MRVLKKMAFSLAIAVSVLSTMSAQAKDFRIGLITPPNHIWTLTAQAFGKELEEKSGGKHKLAVFPAQQLGNEAQMVQQLQTGALDMAFLTLAEISNRVPEFGAFYAPFLVDDIDQAAKLLQSEEAAKLLTELPAKAGVVGIGYGMAGMRQVLSRAPAKGPEDIKGKKIRITPFEPIKDFYNALGAAPTPLPLPAVYDALANGQVDALDMDFDSILVLKFYERAENLMISNHMIFPMVGIVSAKVWAQLSDEDKALIQESMKAHLNQVIEKFAAQEKDQEKQLRELKLTVTEANRETFNDAVNQWEGVWAEKSKGALSILKQVVEKNRAQ